MNYLEIVRLDFPDWKSTCKDVSNGSEKEIKNFNRILKVLIKSTKLKKNQTNIINSMNFFG